MNKDQLLKFVQTNNALKLIANDIISKFVEKEKKIVKDYEQKFGRDAFYKSYFNQYENPFTEGEYIFMFSDKYSDGEMKFEGDVIEINGYYELYESGTESFQFYLDIDLVENYDNKEYLNNRIHDIVTAKIENEYKKSKLILDEEKKKKEELEKLKNDKDYQLYLELKKKYGNNWKMIFK